MFWQYKAEQSHHNHCHLGAELLKEVVPYAIIRNVSCLPTFCPHCELPFELLFFPCPLFDTTACCLRQFLQSCLAFKTFVNSLGLFKSVSRGNVGAAYHLFITSLANSRNFRVWRQNLWTAYLSWEICSCQFLLCVEELITNLPMSNNILQLLASE